MTVPPTVVLVDDSEDLRLVVRMNFERAGHFTVLAEGSSGQDAIDLAEEFHPDVMLLDVSMPGMDGLQALPQVRTVSPTTKVVMFTGFVQQSLGERVRELGATALLEKSLPLRALPAEVERLVGEADSATESPTPAADTAPAAVNIAEEHQERFREVFEEAAIGMGTMTLAGQLVRSNKALAALMQQEADSLVGRRYEDLLADEARSSFRDLLNLVTTTAVGAADGVYQIEHGLADVPVERQVRTTLAPVRDGRGRPLYLFVQLQDVTEQRSVEADLHLTRERVRLLVETVDDAITMLDPDGMIQSWNPGAERMHGYTEDEILGQHFSTLYPQELRRLSHPARVLKLARRDGRYEEEGWRTRQDGSRFWANDVITAITDPDGSSAGFAKIARDVTERRRLWVEQEATGNALGLANAELQAANAGLTQTAEDQAQFLAMTAHELRTPVAVIADLAQALRDDIGDADQQRQVLNTMVSSAGRLQRLLDDLLTAARLDSRAMSLDRRPVSLGAVLRESVEATARRYPDKTVRLDAPDGDDIVFADAERLGQIADNLVNNAINHGQPPVEVSVVPRADTVELRVIDSGAGVPSEVRDRLFDRYVTAARSGTGLGLYIVRELARAHGGEAWHESDQVHPTFVVSLPRHDPRRLAPDTGDASDAVLTGSATA